METIKTNLPKIQDIINSDMDRLEEVNQLNIILNQQPPEKWLKQHPTAKDKNGMPLKYLPIERVEYLLSRIFFQWKVEIKKTQLIGNSVCCEIRLHYFNPITNEWDWQDGIGACPLQTDKGAGATDFNALKSASVMMAAPAAKSYAVKDAAEQIGAIFGKDINRRDAMNYNSLSNNPAFKKDPDAISKIKTEKDAKLAYGKGDISDEQYRNLIINFENGAKN